MTDRSDALLQQAETLHRQGRRPEAIELFRQVLAARPETIEGWYELGYLLKAEGRYDEALEAYAQALARGIKRPEEVHLNRAVIYSDHLRRDALAEQELMAALAIAPAYVPAILNLGNLHEERGEQDAAVACYERIISANGATYPDLYCEALARTAKLRPPASVDDPLIRQLHEAAAAAVAHRAQVRANVLFSLGTVYDRLDEFDLAFDAFAKANRCLLRESGRPYDRMHSTRLTDAMIEAFPSASAAAPATLVESGAAPVFICGMFRSGSTLIEQVLAAHPKVTPGGELDFLMRLAASRLAPFPQSMAKSDPKRDAAFAEEYRAHLARLFPEAKPGTYITDKRPDNFLLIGLIKRMLPDAKIIHTTRHPMGNGLSVFMQHLHHRVAGYSSDLGDIGHYYGQYRRLMTHWKSLYPESIFDFDYDAFVREPVPALQALCDFLGLDWDERTLDFHLLRNTVKTASYWQVRQPLHGNASGRWRKYDTHLGQLRQALVSANVAVD